MIDPYRVITLPGTEPIKVLWGITSSGDMLREVVAAMIDVKGRPTPRPVDIEVMLSKEATFVLKYYGAWDALRQAFPVIHVEKGPNAPFLGGPVQKKKYAFLLVAPVTGNTMAKIARGIADALVPNCVALGLKARVPVYLFPTDQAGVGEETTLRDGSTLQLFPRKIDLENVDVVRAMDHVTVFTSVDEMRDVISRVLEQA